MVMLSVWWRLGRCAHTDKELRRLPVEPTVHGVVVVENWWCYRGGVFWRAIYVLAVRLSPGPLLSGSLSVGVSHHDFCFSWAFFEGFKSPRNLESQRWNGSQPRAKAVMGFSILNQTGSGRVAEKQAWVQGGD